MKNVVVLGGGTGLSVLLRGLKLFPINITAVVSVADDGASTGRLREEFDIPAVGDLRNVLVSLSEVEPIVSDLLQYRFDTYSDLDKHAMGNLLLTAMYNITGSLTESLDSLSKIFNLKGRVLPFTEDKAILMATTQDGEVIEGESNITKAGKQIKTIKYKNLIVLFFIMSKKKSKNFSKLEDLCCREASTKCFDEFFSKPYKLKYSHIRSRRVKAARRAVLRHFLSWGGAKNAADIKYIVDDYVYWIARNTHKLLHPKTSDTYYTD